jgi:hypothetical protein
LTTGSAHSATDQGSGRGDCPPRGHGTYSSFPAPLSHWEGRALSRAGRVGMCKF